MQWKEPCSINWEIKVCWFIHLPYSVIVTERSLCARHHAVISKTWLCLELTVIELETREPVALRM